MSSRRTRTQPIQIEECPINRKIVNFNYSENFNKITELNTENYQRWKYHILYLLSINDLVKYVIQNTIKKLRKRDVKDNLSDYIQDEFDDSLVYEKGTNEIDIRNDITTKWMISNSLGDKTQQIIQGHGKTSYEIWNILKESFTTSVESRKIEIRRKLNEIKFEEEKDINIFMAEFQNLIDELEKIDYDLSDSSKVGLLNRAMPKNLRWINLFQFKDDYKKCSNYLKSIIPECQGFCYTKQITNNLIHKKIRKYK